MTCSHLSHTTSGHTFMNAYLNKEHTKFGTQFSCRHRGYLLHIQQCDSYFIEKYRLIPFLLVTEFLAPKLHPIRRIPCVVEPLLTVTWTARDDNKTITTKDKYGNNMRYTNSTLLQTTFGTESRSLSLPYPELVFMTITFN